MCACLALFVDPLASLFYHAYGDGGHVGEQLSMMAAITMALPRYDIHAKTLTPEPNVTDICVHACRGKVHKINNEVQKKRLTP